MAYAMLNLVGTQRFWILLRRVGPLALCEEFLPERELEPGEWSGRTAGTAMLFPEDLDPTGMIALLG